MRATTASLSLLVLSLATANAGADTLRATRGMDLKETTHDVKVTVKNGIAKYRVRRSVRNRGERHEEAVLDLGLPFGAAATGLRIKTPSGWYEGELMRAERAAALYQELTGFGAHMVKDPALLQWRWANELNLRVFPVAPGAESTVEYTLTGPTRYVDGRYVVSYPLPAEGLANPALWVQGEQPGGSVWVNGLPIGADGRTVVVKPKPPSWAGDDELPESFAFSEITIGDDHEAKKLSVALDVRHTYKQDLEVALRAPNGTWHKLVARGGGSDNDVRSTVEVTVGQDAPVSVKGTWRLVVSDHAALDVGSIDAWSITLAGGDRDKKYAAKDTPKFIPDAPGGEAGSAVTISVEAPPIQTLKARLGRVVASEKVQFFRLEVDAAPELRPLPAHPQVVFVVDASRSVTPTGLDDQLAVVRSFLHNAPAAQFEIVLYRRRAERLFGTFVAAGDLDAELKKVATGKLALGNGSALDEGVRVATDALRRRKGTRMIVMSTDALLRPSWTNAETQKRLGAAGARTSHVVLPRLPRASETWQGNERDRRDDKHALAALATRNGGILLHIDRPGDEGKELDDVTLGLVRPTRIDDFRVLGVTLPSDHGIPSVLHEGMGLREMDIVGKVPGRVELTGKIWSRRFRRVVSGPLSFSEATAAFVFSHDMHHGLSEQEMVRVAFAGKAVTPVTSYLAVEPGVRPSVVGLEQGTGQGFGSGHGLLGSRHAGKAPVVCPPYDLKADVDQPVKACIATHHPAAGWSVTAKVFTTFDEIVDVVLDGKPTALGTCIVDAVWQATLPTCHFAKERDDLTVSFP